jgi:hypothetical protein
LPTNRERWSLMVYSIWILEALLRSVDQFANSLC